MKGSVALPPVLPKTRLVDAAPTAVGANLTVTVIEEFPANTEFIAGSPVAENGAATLPTELTVRETSPVF